jgi:hypothetical protein
MTAVWALPGNFVASERRRTNTHRIALLGQPDQLGVRLNLFAFSGRIWELQKRRRLKAGKTLFAVYYYLTSVPLRYREIMGNLEKCRGQIVIHGLISSINVVCLGLDIDRQDESIVKLKVIGGITWGVL